MKVIIDAYHDIILEGNVGEEIVNIRIGENREPVKVHIDEMERALAVFKPNPNEQALAAFRLKGTK